MEIDALLMPIDENANILGVVFRWNMSSMDPSMVQTIVRAWFGKVLLRLIFPVLIILAQLGRPEQIH